MGNRRQIILTRKTGRKPLRAAGQWLFSLCLAVLFAWLIVCPAAAQPVCTVTKYNEDTGKYEGNSYNVGDHVNVILYKEALDECQELYGKENPRFYERLQAQFAKHTM